MAISRRLLIVGVLSTPALIFGRDRVFGEPLFGELPAGAAPGDYGYMHDKYHDSYQQLFGVTGRCACGFGDCRVTIWRNTLLGSPSGYDVVVLRQWWPLPANVWMPDKATPIPQDLLQDWAHVCAYGESSSGHAIPCALINKKDA